MTVQRNHSVNPLQARILTLHALLTPPDYILYYLIRFTNKLCREPKNPRPQKQKDFSRPCKISVSC